MLVNYLNAIKLLILYSLINYSNPYISFFITVYLKFNFNKICLSQGELSKILNASNICNTKRYTYLCFRNCGEIWTKIITDPFGTTWQGDTPYQQNQ